MFEQPPFDAGRGSASGPADFKTGAAPAPPPLDREHGIRQAGAGGAADADFTSEIKILMLEDSEFDAELTERELRHGDLCFLSRRVMTRDDFEREMTAFKPHIVLADYALPSYDGLSALAFVLERLPLIPFIFVSGAIGEEFAVEGLKQGAKDYILKHHLIRLVPAVRRALEEAKERQEKQRALTALCESEKRYKRLLESVTDYIYTVSAVSVKNGLAERTTHGPGCVAVTGYTSEEYDKDPYLWYRMVHEEDRSGVTAQARAILEGKALNLEHRIIHKDRSIRWVRNTPVPRYDERKRLLSYDGLIVDITDRKDAEEALKKYKDSLEEKVRERTRQFEEARAFAEAANKAKSEFLANMSHELRTPLNSILGFSELMRDGMTGPVSEKQKEYLHDIWASGKHLLRIINDILDLSKVEAGAALLEPAPLFVTALFESCLAMFRERAMRHRLILTAEVAEGLGPITADEQKLKQVLINLVSNAVKFTPDGGSVRVAARLTKDEGRRTKDESGQASLVSASEASGPPSSLEISVTDTGIGIAAEDINKLFQPFQQLDRTLTKRYEGTGLGLHLCKKLVELHGGKIWAESDGAQGSRFIFMLPMSGIKP